MAHTTSAAPKFSCQDFPDGDMRQDFTGRAARRAKNFSVKLQDKNLI